MSEHKIIRILTTGILLTAGAFAQTTSFPKPNYFRETFKNVDTKVELQPPVRLKDFVKDGSSSFRCGTIWRWRWPTTPASRFST